MNMTHLIGSVAAVIVLADILSNGNLRAENPDLLINALELCIVSYAIMCLLPYLLNKLRDKKLVKTYLLASPVIVIWAVMSFIQEIKAEDSSDSGSDIGSLEFKIMLIGVLLAYMTAIILIQRYLQKKKDNKQLAEPM